MKKILVALIGLWFLSAFAAGFHDWITGVKPKSQLQPQPAKVEEVSKKPEPPKVTTPEESYYAESYDAIRAATGMRVTERWMLSYSERLRNDGAVDTHGFVELNGDGVKRQFWLLFDDKTRKCLRVKIDGTLLYTAVGW